MSAIHVLTMGHFESDAIHAGQLRFRRPIDTEVARRVLNRFPIPPDCFPALKGEPVVVSDRYVRLVWRPAPIPSIDTLVRELVRELECEVADLEHGLRVDPHTLKPFRPHEP